MKALLVTGRLAKEVVQRYANQAKVETVVLDLPVVVAALLTPEFIAQQLKTMDLTRFDVVLVPGLIRGDITLVERSCGVSAFKGPKYAADIPIVLSNLGEMKLSKTVPADEVLQESLRTQVLSELYERESERESLLQRLGNFLVGNVPVGRDFPMRVMAEILDAPTLSDQQIRYQSSYYVRSGAQIIDVGMMAGEPKPEDSARVVEAVKREVDVPVAIDTFDLNEAKAAVEAGADMLLSLDTSTIDEAVVFARDTAVVVLPGDHKCSYFPKETSARVKALALSVAKAKDLGYKKVIADPILDPLNMPGLTESLASYRAYSQEYPDVPLLFGAGNITELLDADSIGVNALLAGLASEIGVSILLTTEGSDKTQGAVRELSVGAKMMFVAKRRSSVPKDLGLDLLVLKDKRRLDEVFDRCLQEEMRVFEAKPSPDTPLDSAGNFRILLDREEKRIIAMHFPDEMPKKIIKGPDASSVYSAILNMGFITRLDHAAYLGKELSKAEVALLTGKSYIQDAPLF